MATFLRQVATHILDHYAEDLTDLQIVVPTRRAVFFLKHELAHIAEAPMFSPQIMAIDDFVSGLSPFQIADPVTLIFELYESFHEVDGTLDFDRYMRWGSVLLSDFDKIDQYCTDTGPLFDYLTEARSLERWKDDLPEGRELDAGAEGKPFFLLFERIQQVYHVFRERLQGQKQAYRGMMYRHLAENKDEWVIDHAHFDKCIFAGFNAFSKSEEVIVGSLVQAGKAELLWDTDAYYMEANLNIEGGKYMRDYRTQRFFGENWKWMGDDLLTGRKDITLYGVPNATLQTKLAGQIYTIMKEADPDDSGPTAILLCDENLLSPMLYSLGPEVQDLNVTMGMPLRSSLLFTLIDSLFELQRNTLETPGISGAQFNHKFIIGVLNHQFVRQYEQVTWPAGGEGESAFQKVRDEISQRNRVFLTSDELIKMGGGQPLFSVLFTKWENHDPFQVIQVFYTLIDLLRGVYRQNRHAIETEYLYLFFTLLKQFEQRIQSRRQRITLSTLRAFLYELIRQVKIPFSGEPISDLQLLGILETRALDFKRIIMLSVNEGILPSSGRQNSLIPADIAASAGLPTYQNQEAITSYHFYRMLQKAKDVHILYVDTADDAGGGEKSRYLLQLELELARYNPGIVIEKKVVEFESRLLELPELEIVKDEQVITSIKEHLANKGLYPTDLNRLVRSPLDFYLNCVLGIKEQKDMEEELGMDKLGTWLHRVFEIADIEFLKEDREPSLAQISHILRQEFETAFHGYVTESGLNRVYYRVGEQQALAFYESQLARSPRNRVLAAEQHLRCELEIEVEGERLMVKLGGKIDRVELSHDGTLCIMDYKTGKVELKGKRELNDPELQEEILLRDEGYSTGYVRQLWLYQYLVLREMAKDTGWKISGQTFTLDSNSVSSGFYSLRAPEKPFENPLMFSEDADPYLYISRTEELIGTLVRELLDPAVPLK